MLTATEIAAYTHHADPAVRAMACELLEHRTRAGQYDIATLLVLQDALGPLPELDRMLIGQEP